MWVDLTPYMNQSAPCVDLHAPVSRAYSMLRHLGLRHLPVVDKANAAVGMITRYDLTEEHLEYTARRLQKLQHLQQRQRSGSARTRAAGAGTNQNAKGAGDPMMSFEDYMRLRSRSLAELGGLSAAVPAYSPRYSELQATPIPMESGKHRKHSYRQQQTSKQSRTETSSRVLSLSSSSSSSSSPSASIAPMPPRVNIPQTDFLALSDDYNAL